MTCPRLETPLPTGASPLTIAVGIATRNRRGVLAETLRTVAGQTRRPDRVVVCHSSGADVAGLDPSPGVEFITAPAGLPRQRNAVLDHAADCAVVLFIDDDFLLAPGHVAATLDALQADASIVVTTGAPIADGIKGPGIAASAALAMIAADPPPRAEVLPAQHGYGCNMAIRADVARAHGVRFDERLPLYAWSEDVDFTHRLGRHGRIVTVKAARGVHLGTKLGRGSGRQLGYSQVANPIYLFGKGSYSFGRAARSVGRNVLANLVGSVWSEPWIDRRGRLAGNLRAGFDALRGSLSPEGALGIRP